MLNLCKRIFSTYSIYFVLEKKQQQQQQQKQNNNKIIKETLISRTANPISSSSRVLNNRVFNVARMFNPKRICSKATTFSTNYNLIYEVRDAVSWELERATDFRK